MRKIRVAFPGLIMVAAIGCAKPLDNGVVMACYGVVNQTVSDDGVISPDVVTNVYYGGCSPSDPGMQIVERTTADGLIADQSQLIAACDTDCNARLKAYATSHPDIKLPATCQTLFVAPCDGLGSDATKLTAANFAAFQGGGPADSRFELTGTATLTIDHRSVDVPVSGIADLTISSGTCDSNGCPLILSRFDVVAKDPFTLNGLTISRAQVQNQGVIRGTMTNDAFKFPPNAFELEVNFEGIERPGGSFHVFNDDETVSHPLGDGDLDDFFPDFDAYFGDGTVHLRLKSNLIGHRPVAGIAAHPNQYECICEDCTPVTFTSTSTDVDDDIQSLTWLLNGKVVNPDGQPASETLPLSLALGSYTIALVAGDGRGAASKTTTTSFKVVDTVPPVVTPPPSTTMLSCGFPDIGRPTAVDACSDVIITSDDPGIFRPGTKTVTFIAEDSSFNDGRATATMTQLKVEDDDRAKCCPPWTTNIMWAKPNERLIGTDGNDCLIGTNGDDYIDGGKGDDYIIGGPGNDNLIGGDDNDTIVGNQGDDKIDGGEGNNRIAGGSGNDTITAGSGDDFILGGEGDDIINAGDGTNYVMGGPGRDTLTGGKDADWIDGGDGEDWIFGNDGADTLIGGVGVNNDHIEGGPGNDTLAGLDGDDFLDGGADDDVIIGGRGTDTCVADPTDTVKACEK